MLRRHVKHHGGGESAGIQQVGAVGIARSTPSLAVFPALARCHVCFQIADISPHNLPSCANIAHWVWRTMFTLNSFAAEGYPFFFSG
jgi:hypothetical protein